MKGKSHCQLWIGGNYYFSHLNYKIAPNGLTIVYTIWTSDESDEQEQERKKERITSPLTKMKKKKCTKVTKKHESQLNLEWKVDTWQLNSVF